MMSRYKEDQRNERLIRSLAKLEVNRKCINCGSLGPQFICTNFSTFVCMACSGIHREFTHRVKSISMSKFSSDEVAELQRGGNQRAFEIYFKDWDPHRHPVPDSRNPAKLREFIKAIYVDQIYAGKSAVKGTENNARKSDVRASFVSTLSLQEPVASPHQRAKSEDNAQSHDFSYSPPVRSMREILGDDLPPLRIEPANRKVLPSSSSEDYQRGSQFSRFGSFTGSTATPPNPAAYKRANSEGQIDFNVEVTTPDFASVHQLRQQDLASAPHLPQKNVTSVPELRQQNFAFAPQLPQNDFASAPHLPQQPYVQADTTGWATFDSVPVISASQAEVNQANQSLESTTMLSVPESGQLYGPPWNFREPRPLASEEFLPYDGTSGLPSRSQQFTPVMQQPVTPAATQKSRNPFDLPEDSSTSVSSPSFTFPPIPEFVSPQHSWSQGTFYPFPDAYTDYSSSFTATPPGQPRPGNPFA